MGPLAENATIQVSYRILQGQTLQKELLHEGLVRGTIAGSTSENNVGHIRVHDIPHHWLES